MIALALLWILWCALHSLLITRTVTLWVERRGGWLAGSYRLGYIAFSCLSLVPVLVCQYSLPQQTLFLWQGWGRIPQGLLLGYALLMFLGGKKVYDMDWFLGISQWRGFRNRVPVQARPIRFHGVLRLVRHPWYSGGLAFLWALNPLTDVSLTARIILSLYLVIGAWLEERKLVAALGEVYRRYQRAVPMLVPWKGMVDFHPDRAGSLRP